MLVVYVVGWCSFVDCLSHEETYRAGLMWVAVSLVATALNYWLVFHHETGEKYCDFWGKWGKVYFTFTALSTFPVMPYTVWEFWGNAHTFNQISS